MSFDTTVVGSDRLFVEASFSTNEAGSSFAPESVELSEEEYEPIASNEPNVSLAPKFYSTCSNSV